MSSPADDSTSRQSPETVRLHAYTTWKTGGPAEAVIEPGSDAATLRETLANHGTGEPIWTIGRGSNLWIADDGLPGLTIITRNAMTGIRQDGAVIEAEAGCSLPRLSKFAAKCGYRGYEFLIGIPGTVGGGVCMNAGLSSFYHQEINSVIEAAEILWLDGGSEWLDAKALELDYRTSILHRRRGIVLRARFKLEQPGDPEEVHEQTMANLANRKSKAPLHMPTAGSTFKSPDDGKPAGWYIDSAGLKGHIVGGARISPLHANWVENFDNATSADIAELMAQAIIVVRDQFNLTLQPEVSFFPAMPAIVREALAG